MFERRIDRSGTDGEGAESILDGAASRGIGVTVFSPLCQGLLTNRYLNGIPGDSRAAASPFLPSTRINYQYLAAARALNGIAAARGQSLAQMSLAWVLRDPRVTSAIVGASSVKQLEENVAACQNLALSDEELSAINVACIDFLV